MDREYLRAKLISTYKLTDTDYGQLIMLEGEGFLYKAEHVKDMLERLYNDMSEGKDPILEQKNEFFPSVSNSVCRFCGKKATDVTLFHVGDEGWECVDCGNAEEAKRNIDVYPFKEFFVILDHHLSNPSILTRKEQIVSGSNLECDYAVVFHDIKDAKFAIETSTFRTAAIVQVVNSYDD